MSISSGQLDINTWPKVTQISWYNQFCRYYYCPVHSYPYSVKTVTYNPDTFNLPLSDIPPFTTQSYVCPYCLRGTTTATIVENLPTSDSSTLELECECSVCSCSVKNNGLQSISSTQISNQIECCECPEENALCEVVSKPSPTQAPRPREIEPIIIRTENTLDKKQFKEMEKRLKKLEKVITKSKNEVSKDDICDIYNNIGAISNNVNCISSKLDSLERFGKIMIEVTSKFKDPHQATNKDEPCVTNSIVTSAKELENNELKQITYNNCTDDCCCNHELHGSVSYTKNTGDFITENNPPINTTLNNFYQLVPKNTDGSKGSEIVIKSYNKKSQNQTFTSNYTNLEGSEVPNNKLFENLEYKKNSKRSRSEDKAFLRRTTPKTLRFCECDSNGDNVLYVCRDRPILRSCEGSENVCICKNTSELKSCRGCENFENL